MILHSLFNFVDIVIVGNIPDNGVVNHGDKAILALTLAAYWNMLFMVIVNGISISTVAIVSRYWGELRVEDGQEVARQSLLLMVIISLASVGIGLFSRPLIELIAGPAVTEDTLRMGEQYLLVQMVGAFTMYFLLQITALFRAAGESFWPMVLLVAANLLNVFADLVLVYGWGPFPRMGVLGAAWGTVFSRGIFMLLGFGMLLFGFRNMKIPFRRFRPDFRCMGRLIKIGLPNSAQITVRLAAYMVVHRLVMARGELAGTAFSLTAGRLDMTALFGAAGWGAAASAMVGQNLGAGKLRRAAASGWISTLYGALIAGVMGLLFFAFSGPILESFFYFREQGIHPDVLSHGKTYLAFLCPVYPLLAAGLVLAHAFNGAGDTKTPLIFDALAFLLIQIPLALILRSVPWGGTPLGLNGVYIAMMVTNIVLALLYALWFQVGSWKKKKIQ
jgi:putative MATE family efflux protein